MKQDILIRYIEAGKSIREIATLEGKSAGSIRHWLRKYGLSTKNIKGYAHQCPCGESNPDKFYGHHKSICSACENKRVIERNRQHKLQAVELLGGSCQLCGFNDFPEALDFHHIDPTKKDPKFHQSSNWGMVRMRKELERCALLCANCHRGVHAGHLTL